MPQPNNRTRVTSLWDEEYKETLPRHIQLTLVEKQVEAILERPSQTDLSGMMRKALAQNPFDLFDPEEFKNGLILNRQN